MNSNPASCRETTSANFLTLPLAVTLTLEHVLPLQRKMNVRRSGQEKPGLCMEKRVNKTGRPDAKHIPISATDSRFQHVKVHFHINPKWSHTSFQQLLLYSSQW